MLRLFARVEAAKAPVSGPEGNGTAPPPPTYRPFSLRKLDLPSFTCCLLATYCAGAIPEFRFATAVHVALL